MFRISYFKSNFILGHKPFWLIPLILLTLSACKSKEQVSDNKKKQAPAGIESLSEEAYVAFQLNFFEGLKQKMIGNLPEAVDYLNRSLEYYPLSAASLYEIGRIYDYKQNTDIAIGLIERAHAIDPSNKWYAMTLADLYGRTKNFKNQERVIRSLIKYEPDNMDYSFELANSLIYQGRYKEALKIYDKMERDYGVNEELALRKNKLYMGLKDYNSALKEIEKLTQLYPKDVRYWSMLAEMYQKGGDNQKALKAYEKIKEMEPNNPYVQLSMADYYEKAGERKRSMEVLQDAFRNPELSIDSKIQILLNYFTISERNAEARAEALNLAKITIETHPGDPKGMAMYGDYLYREKKFKEALEQYKGALDTDQNHFLIWSQIMFIYSELDDFNNMASDSKKAMDLFPLQPTFYFFNGVAELQNKNYVAAAKSLNEGKDLVLDNNLLLAQFYANLGEAYYRNKELTKSFKAFDECLNIDGENMIILNNYAYYLSLEAKDLDKAERMSRKTIEKEPKSATYLDTYAWILYKMKRYEEAMKYLRTAMDNGGLKSAVVIEHYGDALWQNGLKQDALKYWKMAKETGEGSEFLEEKITKQSLIE